ncbi:hypothetical protein pb186bvf_020845 [Paramecium bursaria]
MFLMNYFNQSVRGLFCILSSYFVSFWQSSQIENYKILSFNVFKSYDLDYNSTIPPQDLNNINIQYYMKNYFSSDPYTLDVLQQDGRLIY